MSRGLFSRLFGGQDTRPDEAAEARLAAAEAERLAREATIGLPLADQLVLRGAWREDDRLAWHFFTPTRGAGLTVTVDDATGVAHVTPHPGR